MKRRKFLALATASAAGAAWTAAGGDATLSDEDLLGLPRPIRCLGSETVRTIGASYRAQTPDEGTSRALRQALVASLSDRRGSLAARLAARVRQDFAEGRTVTLGGWVLSVTEARQCALHSL